MLGAEEAEESLALMRGVPVAFVSCEFPSLVKNERIAMKITKTQIKLCVRRGKNTSNTTRSPWPV